MAETGQMHEQKAMNSLDRYSYEQHNTQHALRTDGRMDMAVTGYSGWRTAQMQ